MRAYLEVHDPIEIGIQIFEICKGGNLGVFDDACFSLHLRRFTNVVGAKSDLRRSGALAARKFTPKHSILKRRRVRDRCGKLAT